MSRRGWVLYDPVLDETYVWPVNPHTDNGSNVIQNNSAYQVASANYQDVSGDIHTDGVVIFATPEEQERFSYAGNVYTEEQYRDMLEWSAKRYPLELTDDLGRSYSIYIETFEPSRVRSHAYRWKHSYTWAGIILEELS